jgi:hypothetical protein
MITINRESNRMLFEVAQRDEGRCAWGRHREGGRRSCRGACRRSIRFRLQCTRPNTASGRTGTAATGSPACIARKELVQDYADHLKDPMAKLPAPAQWSGWEAYFHIMEYEGDRSVDVH